MKIFSFGSSLTWLAAAGIFLTYVPNTRAHCDTWDGPVVKSAQKALETGEVKLVLHWVQQSDEPEIQKAFQQSLAVRKLAPEAKELADRYFFETLVRVHRAGEGAPYLGLKPAGTPIPPAIVAADKALETRDVAQLVKLLNEQITEGLHRRFKDAAHKKAFKPGDVQAGREYVKAYVEYVHYAERIQSALEAKAGHHSIGAESSGEEQDVEEPGKKKTGHEH